MAKTSTVTLSTGGVGLDTRDFARFAKALRKAEPELAAQLKVRLRAAGNIVANDARLLAADASVTIPPSIKVRVSAATVSVVAGGASIPLAGLMELGNKSKSGGKSDTFHHPVFGNAAAWVEQPTHPYLLPAVEKNAEAAQVAAVEALDWAIRIAVTDEGL